MTIKQVIALKQGQPIVLRPWRSNERLLTSYNPKQWSNALNGYSYRGYLYYADHIELANESDKKAAIELENKRHKRALEDIENLFKGN